MPAQKYTLVPSLSAGGIALAALLMVLLILLTPGAVIVQIKTWLSLPLRPPSTTGLPLDKLVHFAMFALCSWLVARAWLREFGTARLLLLMLGFAALTECLQLLVPGRSGDLPDFFADALGVMVGLTTWSRAKKKARLKNRA